MWRIIDITGDNYNLICNQENLVIVKNNEEKLRAHFSDINSIITHSYSILITGVLMQKLIDYNIPLIICDRTHNPVGILLQTFKHSEYGNRLQLQISASKPLIKKAWKQIIQTKIFNQAKVLSKIGKKEESDLLIKYSKEVKSFDKTNRESVASRVYFSTLFENFRRNSNGNDIINASLNYTYTIIRSCVARSVVGSGLNPSLGIFHSYKHNYFCLIDDLIEPLRPFVDLYVKNNIAEITKNNILTSEVKHLLVKILEKDFDYNSEQLNLTNIIQKYVYSYIEYLSKQTKKISIPML